MKAENSEIYLTMNDFEKISPERLYVASFTQPPDYHTIHRTYFLNGQQIFIKPEGRESWV